MLRAGLRDRIARAGVRRTILSVVLFVIVVFFPFFNDSRHNTVDLLGFLKHRCGQLRLLRG